MEMSHVLLGQLRTSSMISMNILPLLQGHFGRIQLSLSQGGTRRMSQVNLVVLGQEFATIAVFKIISLLNVLMKRKKRMVAN